MYLYPFHNIMTNSFKAADWCGTNWKRTFVSNTSSLLIRTKSLFIARGLDFFPNKSGICALKAIIPVHLQLCSGTLPLHERPVAANLKVSEPVRPPPPPTVLATICPPQPRWTLAPHAVLVTNGDHNPALQHHQRLAVKAGEANELQINTFATFFCVRPAVVLR